MKKLLMLVATLALTLTVATSALTQDMPDLSSAEELPPPNTDYQITGDGALILESDIIYDCEDLQFPNYDVKEYESYSPESQAKIRGRYKEEYDALVRACTEAGYPPKDTLPQTGGVPFVLIPVALLVACGIFTRTVASG